MPTRLRSRFTSVSGVSTSVAVQQHLSGHAAAGHQVVHAVEGFEQRALAAAGGADKRRNAVARNAQVDALERMKFLIIQIEVFDLQACAMLYPLRQFRWPRRQLRAFTADHSSHQQHHRSRGGLGCTCRPSPESTYMCTASVRPELITPLGQSCHGAGGIDEGCGFAHHAADGQNHARQNARSWPEAARCA